MSTNLDNIRSKKGSQELASLQEGTSLLKSIGIVENPRGLRTKPTRFNSPSAFFQPNPFFLYDGGTILYAISSDFFINSQIFLSFSEIQAAYP